eukprot:scaffold2229_cov262-Pinguiococcus_pyrenoidosus.AAC.10
MARTRQRSATKALASMPAPESRAHAIRRRKRRQGASPYQAKQAKQSFGLRSPCESCGTSSTR